MKITYYNIHWLFFLFKNKIYENIKIYFQINKFHIKLDKNILKMHKCTNKEYLLGVQ